MKSGLGSGWGGGSARVWFDGGGAAGRRNSLIGSAGQPARTSAHVATVLPVSQIFLSSAVVRQSTQLFCGLTRTDRPSSATSSSTYSIPASLHSVASDVASGLSSVLIGREASFMSISPAQSFLNPPPVPENAAVTLTPGFAFWNSSATASLMG